MVVSAATTSTVTGTTASSCQSGGLSPVVAAAQGGEECEASGDAQDGAGERGQHLRGRESCADLLGGRAEGAGQRRGVLGVERGRPGDEDGVDGGQRDQRDRDHQQHLVRSVGLGIGPTDELGVVVERCRGLPARRRSR